MTRLLAALPLVTVLAVLAGLGMLARPLVGPLVGLRPPTPVAAAPPTAPATTEATPAPFDARALAALTPFGTPAPPPQAQPEPDPEPEPEPPLDPPTEIVLPTVTLHGVMTARPARNSTAILSSDLSPARLYRVGERIDDVFALVAVHQDHVVLVDPLGDEQLVGFPLPGSLFTDDPRRDSQTGDSQRGASQRGASQTGDGQTGEGQMGEGQTGDSDDALDDEAWLEADGYLPPKGAGAGESSFADDAWGRDPDWPQEP